jgi:hypothetical protein
MRCWASARGWSSSSTGSSAPIQRPKNPERQRWYYSGKKKRHSVKNNLITERRTKKIKALSATCEGKKHDKKLADEQDPPFLKGSRLWKDTGFQGYEPQGVDTFQPRKKPKGGELTPQEKEANRCISRVASGLSTASPESRSSAAPATPIETSRPTSKTHSWRPPADYTTCRLTSPSRPSSRPHGSRNRNGKTPRPFTHLFTIRSHIF